MGRNRGLSPIVGPLLLYCCVPYCFVIIIAEFGAVGDFAGLLAEN